MENIRIGNIEVRKTSYEKYPYEIVKWFRNNYYYHKDLYMPHPQYAGYYILKDDLERGALIYSVHESCFKNKESCYVVLFFKKWKDEEPDMKSVGRRPLQLEEEDTENLKKVINEFYKQWEDEREA